MSMTEDLEQAEAVARAAAVKAMTDRGLNNVEELLPFADPASILRACRWFDSRPSSTTPGALAKLIRQGGMGPQQSRRSGLEDQAAYGEQIRAWLVERMPDVCRADERLVKWTRTLYGDVEANHLAATREPHPAAVAAVVRLHYRHGKGRLTVSEYGGQIREAVALANEEAIADCELIAAKRAKEAE